MYGDFRRRTPLCRVTRASYFYGLFTVYYYWACVIIVTEYFSPLHPPSIIPCYTTRVLPPPYRASLPFSPNRLQCWAFYCAYQLCVRVEQHSIGSMLVPLATLFTHAGYRCTTIGFYDDILLIFHHYSLSNIAFSKLIYKIQINKLKKKSFRCHQSNKINAIKISYCWI